MILYVDTSALLKLYIAEEGSTHFREKIAAASKLYTHIITYAELRAALAKALRMKRINHLKLSALVKKMQKDWMYFSHISVEMELVYRAGELAEQFNLRGFDSIHLAAAERASNISRNSPTFEFAAFDNTLLTGARALGIKTFEPQ